MDREIIRADFDRIARLPGGKVDDWLLPYLPVKMRHALEIGCGKGLFTVELARRSQRVTAIDLSPNMIEAARSRVPEHVELRVADVMEVALPDGEFACAVSIATLHHLPLAEMLRKLARALAPGGVLLVHDLLDAGSLAARAASRLASLVRTRASGEAAAAWAAHEEHDEFLKWSEVKATVRAELPGARLQRHLNWRYTLVWEK